MLVIATATGLVYSNTFGVPFHFDDVLTIVNNPSVRSLAGPSPSSTRYLGYLSFALNHEIHGLSVFGYHLVNVLVHLCNALLVSWLTALTLSTPALRRTEAGALLRRWLPLTAGLLFAVHPIQTQAVTYVSQRFTSLATLFFLVSIALYAKARLTLEDGRRSAGRAGCLYVASVVAAAAAMKSKEISITLPFVVAGYDFLFFDRRRRLALVLLAPFAATALLVPLALATPDQALGEVLRDVSRMTAETPDIPRSVYLLTQSRVVVRYLALLLFPAGQNLDYDFPLSQSLSDPGVIFSVAILLAVASASVWAWRRARASNRPGGELAFFGIAWLFVTLSVESSVIPIRDVINEHRMYLPSVGAAIAVGTILLSGVGRLGSRGSTALGCAAALLITAGPLGAATYARNGVWKDEVTLWSDVVAKSPRKARPHNNLAKAYAVRLRFDDAMRACREAIRLDPAYAHPHFNLGIIYTAKGLPDEAILEYREAIRLDPGCGLAHANLGKVYEATGRIDEARLAYREAQRLDSRAVRCMMR